MKVRGRALGVLSEFAVLALMLVLATIIAVVLAALAYRALVTRLAARGRQEVA